MRLGWIISTGLGLRQAAPSGANPKLGSLVGLSRIHAWGDMEM